MVAANHGLFAACYPSALMPLKRFSLLPLGRGLSSLVAPILTGGMRHSTISSSARDPRKHPRSHITKSIPLSRFLADFFISNTKIHVKDSTGAIGDSAPNVGGWFTVKRGGFHPARAIQKNIREATSQKAPP